ncbi:MAG TPA: dihydrolipoamide acetyltransferase family protein [Actinomycetota bacterium]|nr:dihydrolipoamide acetyltransferase family protein [Actinomycetota bacterium]
MATPVTMPQLGETVVEGTIVKWLKSEGDSVERDEPLFEISTDKVDTEVPSPMAGVLKEIKVQEGETVEVGTELAVIDEGGAAGGDGQAAPEPEREAAAGAAATAEPEAEPADQAPPAEPEAATPKQAPTEEPAREPARAPAPERGPAPASAPAAAAERPAPAERGPRSHILSPLVRRLADEHGIDLSRVQGTGTGGRITKKDITAVIEAGPQPVAAPAAEAEPAPQPAPAAPQAPPRVAAASAEEREEVVQLSHIRRRIAENMTAVLQNTARAWNLVEINVENIVRLRAGAKDRFREREGFSLTYMPFLARAVCDALLAFPDVNARLDLQAGTATYRRYVNLGIAVSYEDGLIVPVVRGADEMNVVGLARAINDVAGRARAKKLKPDEVHGGTFTITNPGPFGSLISVPIMNPGETAILAFDAIEKRPVVIDDALAVRHMVYLSMSWDHRMIDGAVAAQFLGRLKQNLEGWDFTPEVQGYLA